MKSHQSQRMLKRINNDSLRDAEGAEKNVLIIKQLSLGVFARESNQIERLKYNLPGQLINKVL